MEPVFKLSHVERNESGGDEHNGTFGRRFVRNITHDFFKLKQRKKVIRSRTEPKLVTMIRENKSQTKASKKVNHFIPLSIIDCYFQPVKKHIYMMCIENAT